MSGLKNKTAKIRRIFERWTLQFVTAFFVILPRQAGKIKYPMENLKHIKEIEDELKVWRLTLDDLTHEQLKQRDSEIECVKNGGFVLDGISAIYHEIAYAKMGKEHKQ